MVRDLNILSPKRNRKLQTGWEGFFPYYAGFPELFAHEILRSAELPARATVLDPWNGSGTTTYTASQLGLRTVGVDLNPVMVVVARARLLASSEADHLKPLAATILSHAHSAPPALVDDALLGWFQPATAAFIRGIEQNIRRSLVGGMTRSPDGIQLDRISGTAATLYVALFAACRTLALPFRSSNPTWMRLPKDTADRVDVAQIGVARAFANNVRGMANALLAKQQNGFSASEALEMGASSISLSDTATLALADESIDFLLTSPPYCTRIDYTAATRIELAVLAPLLKITSRSLGKQMIGSTQVPAGEITIDERWGLTCSKFLAAIKLHPSKASSGYYYRTHLDYFNKMSRSLMRLVPALKPGAQAVFVVQDSHYKDLHNDLPKIIGEMGEAHGLRLFDRKDFHLRSMSDINPGRKTYQRPSGATEAVLCFVREARHGQ